MGLVSFCWWASRRDAAQRLDSWLMETTTMAVAVAMLAIALPATHETKLVAVWLVATAVRAATFARQGNLLLPTITLTISYYAAALRCGGTGTLWLYLAGLAAMHGGLVLKMYDTTGRGTWGTAAFHYAAGAGWTLMWLWSQTLPARG